MAEIKRVEEIIQYLPPIAYPPIIGVASPDFAMGEMFGALLGLGVDAAKAVGSLAVENATERGEIAAGACAVTDVLLGIYSTNKGIEEKRDFWKGFDYGFGIMQVLGGIANGVLAYLFWTGGKEAVEGLVKNTLRTVGLLPPEQTPKPEAQKKNVQVHRFVVR